MTIILTGDNYNFLSVSARSLNQTWILSLRLKALLDEGLIAALVIDVDKTTTTQARKL